MTCPRTLPDNWRDFLTTDERDITNRWSMYGSDCIQKVGRMWDSGVPGAPLLKTKTAAHDFLTTFVCDAIPLRCVDRSEAAQRAYLVKTYQDGDIDSTEVYASLAHALAFVHDSWDEDMFIDPEDGATIDGHGTLVTLRVVGKRDRDLMLIRVERVDPYDEDPLDADAVAQAVRAGVPGIIALITKG